MLTVKENIVNQLGAALYLYMHVILEPNATPEGLQVSLQNKYFKNQILEAYKSVSVHFPIPIKPKESKKASSQLLIKDIK